MQNGFLQKDGSLSIHGVHIIIAPARAFLLQAAGDGLFDHTFYLCRDGHAFCRGICPVGGEQAVPDPLRVRGAELRKTHGSDPAYAAILDSCEHEAAIYSKYKRYYGYTFFVMQAI